MQRRCFPPSPPASGPTPTGCDKITRRAEFPFHHRANHLQVSSHPVSEEGALAIVTERWDGMRWTRRHRARDGIAGRDKLRERFRGRADGRCRGVRRSRVVPMPQWSASSLSEARKPNRAGVPVSARRRRQESPILREERDIGRKAIAQGMSDRLRCPVCSCAIFFSTLCTRDRGCSVHPAFPAPSFFRGTPKRKPRAPAAARTRTCICCLKSETRSNACPPPYSRTEIPRPCASGFPRCLP